MKNREAKYGRERAERMPVDQEFERIADWSANEVNWLDELCGQEKWMWRWDHVWRWQGWITEFSAVEPSLKQRISNQKSSLPFGSSRYCPWNAGRLPSPRTKPQLWPPRASMVPPALPLYKHSRMINFYQWVSNGSFIVRTFWPWSITKSKTCRGIIAYLRELCCCLVKWVACKMQAIIVGSREQLAIIEPALTVSSRTHPSTQFPQGIFFDANLQIYLACGCQCRILVRHDFHWELIGCAIIAECPIREALFDAGEDDIALWFAVVTYCATCLTHLRQ